MRLVLTPAHVSDAWPGAMLAHHAVSAPVWRNAGAAASSGALLSMVQLCIQQTDKENKIKGLTTTCNWKHCDNEAPTVVTISSMLCLLCLSGYLSM